MGLQIWALLLLLSPGFSETLKLSYSEVIIPRKLEPRDDIDTKEKVSYLIKVEGKFHIVRLLQKKMFLAPNIPVFTYNEKGDLITDYPYIQDDCYYSGYVEDVPESVAVLSTCSGLWGYFMIYDLNYEIEPVKSSSTFQHIIYRMAADEDSPDRCGVTDEDMEDQAAKDREHHISKVQMERQLIVDTPTEAKKPESPPGAPVLVQKRRPLYCYFTNEKGMAPSPEADLNKEPQPFVKEKKDQVRKKLLSDLEKNESKAEVGMEEEPIYEDMATEEPSQNIDVENQPIDPESWKEGDIVTITQPGPYKITALVCDKWPTFAETNAHEEAAETMIEGARAGVDADTNRVSTVKPKEHGRCYGARRCIS